MGRISLVTNPLETAAKQFNLTKVAALSRIKSNAIRFVSGEISKEDLSDPSKYITENSYLSTLLGFSEKRDKPKYLTPFGAAATDYLVIRRKWTETVVTKTTIDYSKLRQEAGQGIFDEAGGYNETVSNEVLSDTITKQTEEFIDLSALVQVSQKKNILLTQVEGRSQSRKEYISGGDYMISISGHIAGRRPEEYPEAQVQMLRRMLESKDVLSVENPLLNRFGINGMIILSFDLSQSTGARNIQHYKIEAVYEKPVEFIMAEATQRAETLQDKLKAMNEWMSLDILTSKIASSIKI